MSNNTGQQGLTLQDLLDAPVGAVIESLDERMAKKTEDGWVLFVEFYEDSLGYPPGSSEQLMNIRPLRFIQE